MSRRVSSENFGHTSACDLIFDPLDRVSRRPKGRRDRDDESVVSLKSRFSWGTTIYCSESPAVSNATLVYTAVPADFDISFDN